MKRLGKNVFAVDTTAEEADRLAKKHAKGEILIMRLPKKLKQGIKDRARRANVPMTSYMIMAESFFARAMQGKARETTTTGRPRTRKAAAGK